MLVIHNIGNVLIFVDAIVSVWMFLLLFINEEWRSTLGRLSLALFGWLAGLLTWLAVHETLTGIVVQTLPSNSAGWYEIGRMLIYGGIMCTMIARIVFGFRNRGHRITWMPYDNGE